MNYKTHLSCFQELPVSCTDILVWEDMANDLTLPQRWIQCSPE